MPKQKQKKNENKFNSTWPLQFTWVKQGLGDSKKAHCKLCRKDFDISNQGLTAIKEHEKSKKHCDIVNMTNKIYKLPFKADSESVEVPPEVPEVVIIEDDPQGSEASATASATASASATVSATASATTSATASTTAAPTAPVRHVLSK
jgi:hypothetical protein